LTKTLFAATAGEQISSRAQLATRSRRADIGHQSAMPALGGARYTLKQVVTELSVIIPAWNERENLELMLPVLWKTIARMQVTAEILVIDGGSSDGTREAAERLGARVIPQKERGYGGALLTAFAEAQAPYIASMDADLSHPPDFLEEFWKRRHDAEMLIASRYVPGGRAEMTRFRLLLSRILNLTFRRALSVPLRDMSSGFRFYRREIVAGLDLASRDFDVLEEILVKAYNQGWNIREVPFHYMPRVTGKSHAKLIQFGKAYLRTIVRMWQMRNAVDAADYEYRAFKSPVWLQRYWQHERRRLVTKFAGGAGRTLDIGCGSSRILLSMPAAIGVDLSHWKLRWLRPHHPSLAEARAESLPFRDGSFPAVVCSQVLQYVSEPDRALAEAWRVLKPGGVLVIGIPDHGRWTWRLLERMYLKILPFTRRPYGHPFTRKRLEAELRRSGFEIERCRYIGHSELIVRARKPAASQIARL
jgi:dolichol-phosphate mannosyltransferase